MATSVGSEDPGALTTGAYVQTDIHAEGTVGGMFAAPPGDIGDYMPSAEEGAAGVIGDVSFGGPSGGNAPGPSPADGVDTTIYDTQPEEPMMSLAPWQGGVEV